MICIAIFCYGASFKNTPGHVRTRTCVAGLSQQTFYDTLVE